MKVLILSCIIFLLIISLKTVFAQIPNFGSATGFALFTSNGAVSNTAVSTITGNIGTNTGTISGIGFPSTVNGDLHVQDDTTAQAAIDLLNAYNQLFNTAPSMPAHTAAFGTETVTAGIYGVPAAGSLGGNLTIDAEGNANAVFIFKFGGAFTVGAGSTVILTNGALAGNVIWVAEGAISMAANSIMKGTLIANNGANSLGANSNLEGRMYSTTGAINTNTDTVTKPTSGGYIPLPVELVSFTGMCTNSNIVLKWVTASETNNYYFAIEKSNNGFKWDIIAQIDGAINSVVLRSYTYTDKAGQKGDYYYRLKQTDLDGRFKYGPTIYIKNCGQADPDNILIYPNPGNGKFTIIYTGDRSKFKLIEVFNGQGERVFVTSGLQTPVDVTGKAPGLYYVRFHIKADIYIQKLILN